MKIGRRPEDLAYANSIKPIRNRMRKYDYRSLLDAMLSYLNAPVSGDHMKDLGRLPWVVERLLIWLFGDHPREYGSITAKESDVRRLIDQAWSAADKGYAGSGPIKEIGLFARQAFLPQIPYQKSLDTHAYAIQLFLVKRLPKNSNLRKFFDAQAGMPIEEFFEIALLYWSHSTSVRPWFNEKFVRSLDPVFSINRQRIFLQSITTDLEDFQFRSRSRTIQLDEWFQPTYFYRTPCVLHSGAIVPFGPPTIRRHFEALLGDWLAESDQVKLRQDYDCLVERYVADALTRAEVDFLAEQDVRMLIGQVKVADFLVEGGESVILFEVKNKGLSQAIPASRDPLEIASRLKATIIKARNQLQSTESALRVIPKYQNSIFYRIVVTTSDLWLSSVESLIDAEDGDERTWLVCLEDLDMLVDVVRSSSHTMGEVFSLFQESQRDAVSSTYSLSMFLERLALKPDKHPDHLLEVIDQVFSRIDSKLGRR